MRLLSPMIVEEMLVVEPHELADQVSIRIVRGSFDLEIGDPEELGKIVQMQDYPGREEGLAAAGLQA